MARDFALNRELSLGFDEAMARLPAVLGAEGFGVLTQVDVTETFAARLEQPFRRYRILGVCNPSLAHRALTLNLAAGVMLPCNVALWERDDGRAEVAIVDPTLAPPVASDPALEQLAHEVRERLERVANALATAR